MWPDGPCRWGLNGMLRKWFSAWATWPSGGHSNFWVGYWNFIAGIKYLKFKTQWKVFLSPAYPAAQKSACFPFKPKLGLRMRHMSLKSKKHNVGAYFCHCMTVRLLGIIRIYNQQCGNKVTLFTAHYLFTALVTAILNFSYLHLDG
jgi:hypothetical protein